jgi:DNA invertase Pin-like site-specific DNA recombinase
LDRFSCREGVLETLQHLKRLSSYGVAFKSFTEQYLDGAGIFKDAIIGILAALAHQERVRLSERALSPGWNAPGSRAGWADVPK